MAVSPVCLAEVVRDPTRPPQSVQSTEPAAEPARREYVLQSTRVSGELRSAVINNQVVRVGDRVEGARVLSVDLARARLRDPRGEFTIRLALPQVTRPARHTQAPGEANP
jgi:MSHA biogenesis protein MshK